MKRGISLTFITLFVLSLCIFSFGQKNKLFKPNYKNEKPSTKFGLTQAFTEGRGVYLKWQMNVEINNIGFNVYRFEGFRKIRVNPNLVGGGYLKDGVESSFGLDYSFFDPTGNFRNTYVVESFDLAGKRVASTYIYPRFVKDLTPISGLSNEAMLKASIKENNFAEKIEPILPRQLAEEIAQNVLPPNLDKQRFIASQPGVKIGVEKDGIYRVTKTQLDTAGFDVNQPSEKWQLYVNGVEQGIIVSENNEYIEFYGKGVDTNETGTQIYYLINGTNNGKRIKGAIRRKISGNVVSKSFRNSTFKKDPKVYLGKIRNGQQSNFFSDKIINSNGVTVDFDVNDIDYAHGKSRIVITVQGFSLLPHNIEVSLNDETLGNITGAHREFMTMDILIPTAFLIDGTNSLHFNTIEGSTAISFWDSVRVDYRKLYKTQQNELSFYTIPYRASSITGFSSPNIRVFDLTFPDEPKVLTNLRITEDNGDFSVYLPANRSKNFYAVEDTMILQPSSIKQNSPSTISTTDHNGKLIIVSYKDWLAEATAWANYRAQEGFSTQVVDVEDIFDEFNYGRISADAIRSFLNFAKNNWATPPDYVLLLGDTSYDPRDYGNQGNINYMPVQMIDTLYEETGIDEAMADFDNDGLAEIAIGRIPVRDAATVSLVLNKVQIFEQTVENGLDRGVLFTSDVPSGYDFQALNQRLANELPAEVTKVFVSRTDPNARTNLLNELDTGKYLVNYSGHGASGLWATQSFYSIFDVPDMQNENNLSIFSMLTCLNGYFLRTNGFSLAEVLVHKEDGGGVAVWASTGLTTPDIQEVMGRKFFQNFSDSNVERMGDSIKSAKESLSGGRDVRLSWALIGDPLLKIK